MVRIALLALLLIAATTTVVDAQAPAPPQAPCEDRLGVTGFYSDALKQSQDNLQQDVALLKYRLMRALQERNAAQTEAERLRKKYETKPPVESKADPAPVPAPVPPPAP